MTSVALLGHFYLDLLRSRVRLSATAANCREIGSLVHLIGHYALEAKAIADSIPGDFSRFCTDKPQICGVTAASYNEIAVRLLIATFERFCTELRHRLLADKCPLSRKLIKAAKLTTVCTDPSHAGFLAILFASAIRRALSGWDWKEELSVLVGVEFGRALDRRNPTQRAGRPPNFKDEELLDLLAEHPGRPGVYEVLSDLKKRYPDRHITRTGLAKRLQRLRRTRAAC